MPILKESVVHLFFNWTIFNLSATFSSWSRSLRSWWSYGCIEPWRKRIIRTIFSLALSLGMGLKPHWLCLSINFWRGQEQCDCSAISWILGSFQWHLSLLRASNLLLGTVQGISWNWEQATKCTPDTLSSMVWIDWIYLCHRKWVRSETLKLWNFFCNLFHISIWN